MPEIGVLEKKKMIEVEKKYSASISSLQYLEKYARFIKKIKLVDVYYDTSDYKLTLKDEWLRKRGEKFELKVGVKGENDSIDRYHEITDDIAIMHHLHLKELSLEEALKQASILPFATLKTIRKKYILDTCSIDLDETSFDKTSFDEASLDETSFDETSFDETSFNETSFNHKSKNSKKPLVYSLIEIEKMVSNEEEIPSAENTIEKLAKKLHLKEKGYSKLTVFLALKRKSHYLALYKAKVVEACPYFHAK